MYNRAPIILFSLFFILYFHAAAQEPALLSGKTIDAQDSTVLPQVQIEIKNQHGNNTTLYSDTFGNIKLPLGQHNIIASAIGYDTTRTTLTIEKNSLPAFFISLTPSQLLIKTIQLQTNSSRLKNHYRKTTLHTALIKRNAQLLGESDLMKAIQLTPGVSASSESSSKFFVRGGGADENNIILDGAPIHNSGHMLGFFSSFNSDIIGHADFYKGTAPAEYSGGIASNLDIRTRHLTDSTLHIDAGLGILASRITIRGPISQPNSNFMLGMRRGSSWLLTQVANIDELHQSDLDFNDVNGKLQFHLQRNTTISLSAFHGTDRFNYRDLFDFRWKNSSASLIFNTDPTRNLSSELLLTYSNYQSQSEIDEGVLNFQSINQIKNWNINTHHDLTINTNHGVRLSTQLQYTALNPNLNRENPTDDQQAAWETALSIHHDWRTGRILRVSAGLRMSRYSNSDKDTPHFTHHDFYLEPRVQLSIEQSKRLYYTINYGRTVQRLMQKSNTTTSMPSDQFILNNPLLKPMIADQITIGLSKTTRNNRTSFRSDIYYKNVLNQIDVGNESHYPDGYNASIDLISGVGRAYGIEFLVDTHIGSADITASYALSKSERKFEEINNGHWFKSRQDQTHNVSLSFAKKITKRWALQGNWIYVTGQAFTIPYGKYRINNTTHLLYADRNTYRKPDYHRLNFSLIFSPLVRFRENSSKKQLDIIFAVYNVYNRKNAYIIDFRTNSENYYQTDAYQIALFGAVPSLSLNLTL